MQITDIRINQSVRHPDHDGCGSVTKIEPKDIEVFFNDGKRTLDIHEIERIQPVGIVDMGHLSALEDLLAAAALAGLKAIKDEQKDITEIGTRWDGGNMTLQPRDSSLQPKEVPLDVFFHKIVMVRDNLRVLEQKINSNSKLSEGDKVEIQQYISRIAGSLTTFNILFKQKEDQFK